MNRNELFITSNLVLVFILVVFGLFTGEVGVLIYGPIQILIILFHKRQIESKGLKEQSLVQRRKEWILSVFKRTFKEFRFDSNHEWFIKKKSSNPNIEGLILQELGIPSPKDPVVHNAPDVSFVETEITKLEERASIMLGVTVFIPVVFAIIHLFRSVSFPVFGIEFLIALSLAQIVIFTQDLSYDYRGWKNSFSELMKIRDVLNSMGRASLLGGRYGVRNSIHQEIGLEPEINTEKPSYQVFGLIYKLVIQLPHYQREEAISRIARDLQDLPKQEEILDTRWNAYKTRVVLIGLAGTAVGALISGIAQFSIPQVSEELPSIASTPFLVAGMFLLIMGINWLVLSKWFDRDRQGFYLVLFGIVFWVFFAINSFFYI